MPWQEEFDDEDDWNPSKAAGVCLMLLATCCEDAIVPFVLPFVKDNIKSSNWRYRDAALMAFGKSDCAIRFTSFVCMYLKSIFNFKMGANF